MINVQVLLIKLKFRVSGSGFEVYFNPEPETEFYLAMLTLPFVAVLAFAFGFVCGEFKA